MALLVTLAGVVVLVVGAELLLRGAVALALKARIAPLVIGLTVVSLGTSAPELVVSVLAALKGEPGIALGNVIGSNIVNVSLVLGSCVLVFPIGVDRDAYRIHWPVMMAATVLLIARLSNGQLSRSEGLVFVGLLMAYVTWMILRSRRQWIPPSEEQAEATRSLPKALLMVLLGALGLTFGGDWFVRGASDLAKELGVSDRLIGLTVVAAGTSMPELVASLVAAFRKQPDISLGNLIGSNIFNILAILGAASAVEPMHLELSDFLVDLLIMAAVSALLYPMARLSRRMGRVHGTILTVIYLAYLAFVIARG
ncbi:MAG: calcium/sodium antiporter [Flavobacteriales bacterium]|nr:calcium/sodium antiporter [Flavobacteriales bacterium]